MARRLVMRRLVVQAVRSHCATEGAAELVEVVAWLVQVEALGDRVDRLAHLPDAALAGALSLARHRGGAAHRRTALATAHLVHVPDLAPHVVAMVALALVAPVPRRGVPPTVREQWWRHDQRPRGRSLTQ